MDWNEKNLEEFIRTHKSEFDRYNANDFHEERFLAKLARKFKKFISIVPYLIRVFIVTIIIFVVSIWAWNEFIRKDRHEVTLKQKITNIITIK